jgi:molecular chaperone HscB
MKAPDHFGQFGLPERFEIDLSELERRYLALSRELHPDRHAAGGASQRLAAVQKTTDLNQAYQVLKDDFRRAEHLLHRRGLETTEGDSQDQRITVDNDLLMEMMELNEAAAEARAAHDRARLDALAADVRGRSERTWAQLRQGFAEVEAGQAEPLRQLVAELTALRYYRRFLDGLDADEEG